MDRVYELFHSLSCTLTVIYIDAVDRYTTDDIFSSFTPLSLNISHVELIQPCMIQQYFDIIFKDSQSLILFLFEHSNFYIYTSVTYVKGRERDNLLSGKYSCVSDVLVDTGHKTSTCATK